MIREAYDKDDVDDMESEYIGNPTTEIGLTSSRAMIE